MCKYITNIKSNYFKEYLLYIVLIQIYVIYAYVIYIYIYMACKIKDNT